MKQQKASSRNFISLSRFMAWLMPDFDQEEYAHTWFSRKTHGMLFDLEHKAVPNLQLEFARRDGFVCIECHYGSRFVGFKGLFEKTPNGLDDINRLHSITLFLGKEGTWGPEPYAYYTLEPERHKDIEKHYQLDLTRLEATRLMTNNVLRAIITNQPLNMDDYSAVFEPSPIRKIPVPGPWRLQAGRLRTLSQRQRPDSRNLAAHKRLYPI